MIIYGHLIRACMVPSCIQDSYLTLLWGEKGSARYVLGANFDCPTFQRGLGFDVYKIPKDKLYEHCFLNVAFRRKVWKHFYSSYSRQFSKDSEKVTYCPIRFVFLDWWFMVIMCFLLWRQYRNFLLRLKVYFVIKCDMILY